MKPILRTTAFCLSAALLAGALAGCGSKGSKETTTMSNQTTPGVNTGEPTFGTDAPKPGTAPVTITHESNVFVFDDEKEQLTVELCSARTARVQYSANGSNGYRPEDPEYYMVQKEVFDDVKHVYVETDEGAVIRTESMELRIQAAPFRVSLYDLDGNLISGDTDKGIYTQGKTVGVRKKEGSANAGGIFGFGSGDHGRRRNLNRYSQDFTEFTMSHGRVVAPFFMSTVGYGVFLNTISQNTTFFKKGGGFQTEGYLDYFYMYGPDFKSILNEYAEITGRMELYGKWALGSMLSKYGNENATQAEFIEWITRLREEGYPCDSYVFDYGWRGDVNVKEANHSAGEKWGNQMWSNDTKKFPDIAKMFEIAREMGFHVGLHNNAGTPEASGGAQLFKPPYSDKWVKSYMDSVITTGFGDWFWPDEFDVLGSNTAPTFAALGAYEAWKAYTDASRPMFITRGSYAGQHFATAWSGDIDPTEADLTYQIGYALDTGLIGYWATSCDLGGFKSRPSDALYTRWVAQFGAWSAIMRTHGHGGREPWTYNETAQETLKENLRIRYALYPYLYTTAWQGYSAGVPMMRAMILEDGSQNNPDAWDLNRQYYLGDWFLVAPATQAKDTTVSVWFPPNTTWYNYYTGERYEGGENGRTLRVPAGLTEIPVFVKAGAIIPMGPDVNYADEYPLDPLTLDIYPRGTSTYTLYEDDGTSRKYQTENAYSTTTYTCTQVGGTVTLAIGERFNGNAAVFTPVDRSYNLIIHHVGKVSSVTLDGKTLTAYSTLANYDAASEGYYLDGTTLYVKFADTAKAMTLTVQSAGIVEPAEADVSSDESSALPAIENGTLYELENAELQPKDDSTPLFVDGEWKGYTGDGFIKPFKTTGDALTFDGNVKTGGTYSLIIRVNCGKKNDAKYDSSNRTGTLYIDGEKVADLSFKVTDTWGDGSKNGVWLEYTYPNIELSEGKHTFTIVAEGSNPGNYNLDSMKFVTGDASVNGFEKVEAESASDLHGFTTGTVGTVSTQTSGSYLGFARILAADKKTITLRVRSSTGGTLTVFETGVGDKILAQIDLPSDGAWHTITAPCKNTDDALSAIYLEFRTASNGKLDVSLDWFSFSEKVGEGEDDPAAGLPVIENGTLYELENAKLRSQDTSALNVMKVDGEWKGYTGEGFVKPFKIAGDLLTFDANVKAGGSYSMTIRVNCGKKNDAKYDSSNRTGALYVDGVKVADLSFKVTDTWGDSAKNGVWNEYTLPDVNLSAGVHTFTIVAEGSNPGNYNLDSLKFTKK